VSSGTIGVREALQRSEAQRNENEPNSVHTRISMSRPVPRSTQLVFQDSLSSGLLSLGNDERTRVTQSAPPGWYQAVTDPPGTERYWDGSQWSGDTRPGVSPPPTQPAHVTGGGPIGRPRSVGLTILVAIVTFGLWTVLWSYWNGEELRDYRRNGLGGVGYLLLTFFIYPVTMFLMANEVERLYVEAGKRPQITSLWGLWFLLPLIGNIIWYVRIQHAINDFWQARGGTTRPGLA
jgi:hypothetical protein